MMNVIWIMLLVAHISYVDWPLVNAMQFIGTIVAETFNLGVAWCMLGSMKHIYQTDILVVNSPWKCSGDHVFFDASVIWVWLVPRGFLASLEYISPIKLVLLRWGNCSSYCVVGTEGLSKG